MMTYRQWRVGYLGRINTAATVDGVPLSNGNVMHLQYMDYCERYRAAHC